MMSINHMHRMNQRRTMLNLRYSVFGMLLMLLLVSATVAFAWREWSASRQLSAALNQAKQSGQAVDDASMADWFERHTSKDKTATWSEILSLASSDAIRSRTYRFTNRLSETEGSEKQSTTLKQGSDEYYRELGRFLDEVRALLTLIQTESHLEKPVWLPIRFDGVNTHAECVGNSYQVQRLVELQFEMEMHERDTSKAMESLETMHRCLLAFDWGIMPQYHWNQRTGLYDTISKSLDYDFWSEEQLRGLKDFLGPIDLAAEWSSMVDADQALYAKAFSADDEQLSGEERAIQGLILWPSTRKQNWDDGRAASQIGRVGWDSLDEATKTFEKRKRLISQGMSLSYSNFQIRTQEWYRRLLLVCVDLRIFHKQNGRWPKGLDEVAGPRSMAIDFKSPGGRAFEYQLVQDEREANLTSHYSDATRSQFSKWDQEYRKEMDDWQRFHWLQKNWATRSYFSVTLSQDVPPKSPKAQSRPGESSNDK
ncbi:MAG: hypothetical protein ABL921_20075 [Pirellula sp.]